MTVSWRNISHFQESVCFCLVKLIFPSFTLNWGPKFDRNDPKFDRNQSKNKYRFCQISGSLLSNIGADFVKHLGQLGSRLHESTVYTENVRGACTRAPFGPPRGPERAGKRISSPAGKYQFYLVKWHLYARGGALLWRKIDFS